VPPVSTDSEHRSRAELNGLQLREFADDRVVWERSVPPNALSFNGPVGIRSDNARLQLRLLTAPALGPVQRPCPGAGGEGG